MEWFYRHKWQLIFLLCLLLINLMLIVQNIFTKELDLWISNVQTKIVDGIFHYQVTLKSSKPIEESALIDLIYEDGTKETLSWDLRNKKEIFNFTSSKRLEYLLLKSPENIPDRVQNNNHYILNLWSESLKLFESYSLPEYDYTVDNQGRFWFISAARQEKNNNSSIFLTVLSSDGKFLIDKKQLDLPDLYSRYPTIRYLKDGKIHIFWSSYSKKENKSFLCHTTFFDINGELTQGIYDKITFKNITYLRPTFLSNKRTDPILLVQTELNDKTGFTLYIVKQNGIKKLTDLSDGKKPIYYDTNKINDLVFLSDTEGNYLIIWTELSYGQSEIYLSKITPQGEILISRKKLYSLLSRATISSLNTLYKGDQLLFIWNEYNKNALSMYKICYMITDTNGEILQNKDILIGPSNKQIQNVSAVFDENENINLVWSDSRFGQPKPNCDLIFSKLTDTFEILTPMYRVTTNLVEQKSPLQKSINNIRYLTWREYNKGKYEIYLKNTDPTFIEAIYRQTKKNNRIIRAVNSILVFLTNLLTKGFLLLALNIFPLIGIIICIFLFSFNKIRNTYFTWVSICLIVLFLKFLNLEVIPDHLIHFFNLGKTTFIKVNLSTFLLIVLIYIIVEVFFKKRIISFEKRFLYLFGWLIFDSFTLVLVDYLNFI
ncbi:hypothetical protein BBF96_02955 [Anoxybacter fermentans]|uniref:Uncharacterized protein n=1 Tax=Anoxybacter fermentans TaxID=1323375 RepID=A0A3S9SVX3_9FIRM|nr:hypothetical protein [Anoxybacter fermentans]AZR72441.1 hypothetical protein BBF96_02955 [Anoxybacter fermentans]